MVRKRYDLPDLDPCFLGSLEKGAPMRSDVLVNRDETVHTSKTRTSGSMVGAVDQAG